MPVANLITADDLGTQIREIDFVGRFTQSIKDLMALLGITETQKLSTDAIIKLYTWSVTEPGTEGIVPEGEDILLTKIERTLSRSITMLLKKYRSQITFEAVNRHGADVAINQADERLIRSIQNDIKKRFFAFLDLAPTTQTAKTLQEAIALGWGKTQSFFDNANGFVTLVNPMDIATFLGGGSITSGGETLYGLTLLEGFVGQKVMAFNDVPVNTVYTTASENLNLAAMDINGDAGSAFNMHTDESGLIGVYFGNPDTKTATKELLAVNNIAIFAEVPEGVVKTTITP